MKPKTNFLRLFYQIRNVRNDSHRTHSRMFIQPQVTGELWRCVMSKMMMSMPAELARPCRQDETLPRPTMEMRLSRLGANLDRMIEKLDASTRAARHKLNGSLEDLASRCTAAWSELKPALRRAGVAMRRGFARAADRFCHPRIA